MSFIGVVCEYNPFHLGHALHLERSRRAAGDLPVVCVMSGDFVQRGEAALEDKFARSEAACRCGADAVFELPLPWALSSAEGFARGAVALLGALGASCLSFGAEDADIPRLSALASALCRAETVESARAKMAAEPELSFAAAREAALRDILGADAELIEKPNNILAVEYLKAVEQLDLDLEPLAIPRSGAGHDSVSDVELRSAAEIRAMLLRGEDALRCMPEASAEIYMRELRSGRLPEPSALEAAMLSRLRTLGEAELCKLPDAGGGLAQRLRRAAAEEPDIGAVCAAVKNKRLAMSRVRRAVCCAALGVTADMAAGAPPYARLLAANARGRKLLGEIKKNCSVPIVTRPSVVREFGGEAEHIFSLGAAAHDLYALARPAVEQRRGGEDWRASPAML